MAEIDHCVRLLLRNTSQLKIKTKYLTFAHRSELSIAYRMLILKILRNALIKQTF